MSDYSLNHTDMKKIIYTILLTCFLLPGITFAQTVIRGTVKDNTGGIPGVTVREKNNLGNGTSTNVNGEFQLSLKGTNKIIEISFLGFVTQEVNTTGKTNVTITLQEDLKNLDEVVVTGYGTVKKITNTGAISTVSGADVRTTPTTNVQNTLAGRAPGFFSQQRSGQPGKTGSDFYIRGVNSLASESQKPLVIVDDVEYTYDQLSQIDVNEIESFTILKDASTTAVYGIKGANGVVVVTTRRGKVGKPRVTFNTESGLQEAVHVPNFLNSFQVATLKNEAIANDNDGTPPEFSPEDLEHWRTGDDPYGHPDVNWYKALFKQFAYQNRNSIDIQGGSEKIKYFISTGQVYQDGLLRNFSKGNYEAPQNNYAYERYTFRTNLDMQATKDLKLRLDVSGRIGNTTEPHVTGSISNVSALSTIYSFGRLPPYAEPLLNPDGSYPWAKRSRNIFYETSILGRLALQGYDKTYRNEFNILFGADHKLDFITKGLSVSGRIAYAGDVSYARGLNRNAIPAFYYDPVAQTYTPASNGLYRLDPLSLSSSGTNISNKTVNSLGKIDYNKTFGNHNVYGFVLYNLNNVINANGSQEYAPVSSQGYTFKTGYNYKQRYLIDFSGAYNGTSQFVGNKTKGFFPAVSAGWNIAEEPYIKKKFKFLDLLKLRGSYGLTGSDITKGNNYKTDQVYNGGPNYSFGDTNNTFSSIEEGSLGNLDITWEKSKKFDVGIDAQLFKSKLSLTIDYFSDYRYDQLFIKQNTLNIIGVTLPYTNSAITENKGYDGQVSYRDNIGKVNYNASFVFSFAKNKIIDQGEAPPRYAYLAKTGQPIGQPFGYNSLGFFQTADEVANYAHLANAKPGDLKYEDLNGDGVIDQQDYRAIGKPNLPQTVLGSTLGIGYKGFSVSVLFQGSFNYSYAIGTQASIPFQANLQENALGRWTPTNNINATFPRLSANVAGPSSPSNSSTFWMVNAKYIRLKSVDLGYSLPKKWVGALNLSTARIYFSGYDLFTWSNFSLYSQDPEVANGASGGTYPVQKVYNVGLQVGF